LSDVGGVALASLTGEAIRGAIPALADLRVCIFRGWPYLYDGDLAYEAAYLDKYAATPGALVVTATAGDGAIVGASTALPLAAAETELHAPFVAKGLALADWCYFGESLLDPAWRGRGIGVAFFAARETHAAALGLEHSCFCAVERPADHPARPADYVPLDAFWHNRGYQRRDDMTALFTWRDVGEAGETAKPMRFWTKSR